MLIWPARGPTLEKAVCEFLTNILQIPEDTVKEFRYEHLEKIRQTRRSKIEDEVLVRFSTATDRDVAQSYASNLATAGSYVGLRLHVPEHLKGLFKQFEKHAGELKAKNPGLMRSMKQDDATQSLALDVKLSLSMSWQRISDHEMRQLTKLHTERNTLTSQANTSGKIAEERRAALLLEGAQFRSGQEAWSSMNE